MALEQTQTSVRCWHEMLNTQNMAILSELLADEVVFHSPVAYQPYQGKQQVIFILSNVIQVFENFMYHREYYSADGLNVVLEFSASIGEKKLKGIDMLRFNDQGQIIDFEVMVRLQSGLQELAVQMGQRLAAFARKSS